MSLKKLGRYDLIRVLGKGAMGLVYEARDPNLDRRVAIKTIKVENLSDAAAAEYEVRFRTEARSAARLQHPNIVSVYDSDRDGDIAFLVMEFIQGDDLKHHLDQGELYSLEKTLGIMGDLLSALDYAHRQNIVHRDIKPANLLVEASGRIKLTDFGVARIQDSGEATRTQGSIVGTLKYMSPEQLQGRPIDARADLFAAGVVLYQLLTGQRPFDGDTDFAIIQQIVGHNPDAATSFNPKLPPAMDAMVAQALAKSRDQRFATAQEFSAALQAASREAADPTALPPVSAVGRGSSSTWTATMRAGEALVGTHPGAGSNTNTGTSTSIGGSTVTQEVELVYWKDIKDSNDLEDLQGFLVKFPAGIYADLARRRLKKLGALPGEDSDTGRTDTVTQLAAVSATQFDKTQLLPARGAPARAGTASENTDLAWRALEQTAAQTLLPVQAQPVANPGEDTDATRMGALAAPPEAAVATPMAEAPGEATRAPATASASAPTSRRMVWVMAGIAALAAAGIGFRLLSGSGGPVPAAQAPALAPSGVASAAVAALVNASAPAASAASRAAAPAAVAAKKGVNDKDKPTKEAAAREMPAKVAPPERAAQAPAVSPRQACEDRVLIGFQNCMSEQCAKPVFINHPLCVERRTMEQQRRDADRLR